MTAKEQSAKDAPARSTWRPPSRRLMTRSDAPVWRTVVALGCCGLLSGFVVAILAVFMAGAGHGWNEGFVSSVALALAPLAGVAWAYRRRLGGPIIACVVLAAAACFDWWLCSNTYGFDRAWANLPGIVVLWALLWLAWQVLAVCVLLSRLLRPGMRSKHP
jgi:hypothetical protein